MDLKKIIGIFVEMPDEKLTTEPKKATATTGAVGTGAYTQPPLYSPASSPSRTNEVTASDMERFEQYFTKLFDKSNQPGPDYYEFSKMDDNLSAHISNDTERLKIVFSSFQIQNVTKEHLLASIEYYKKVINDDRPNFEQILEQKNNSGLEAKKLEISANQQKIIDNTEAIARMTAEIEQSRIKVATLSEQVNEEESKMNSIKNGYNMASQAILNKLNNDAQKIQTTL